MNLPTKNFIILHEYTDSALDEMGFEDYEDDIYDEQLDNSRFYQKDIVEKLKSGEEPEITLEEIRVAAHTVGVRPEMLLKEDLGMFTIKLSLNILYTGDVDELDYTADPEYVNLKCVTLSVEGDKCLSYYLPKELISKIQHGLREISPIPRVPKEL